MTENLPGRKTFLRRARAAGLCLLLAMVLGCGGTGSVTGTVTHKPSGKKLAWGSVTMIGGNGIAHSGPINPDGTYTVANVPSGKVKVLVASYNPKPQAAGGGRMGRRPAPGDAPEPEAPPEVVKAWFPIHEKYADAAKSPLTAEVKKGPNTHDITLE